MTTEIAQVESLNQIQTGLQAFQERKQIIENLANSAKEVTLIDFNDKTQLSMVSEKRKELKASRVSVEKEAKAMRDLITPISKHISEKEKELVKIIEPEETRLEDLEKEAKAFIEKEKQNAIDAENARIQKRIDALAEFGYQIDYTDVKSMSDEIFGKYLEGAKLQFEKEQTEKEEAERLRIEQEEKERIEREAEAKRMQEERAELERMRAEQVAIAKLQKEAQDKIDAANKKIEDDRKQAEAAKQKEIEDKKRADELEAAKVKAAEDARLKAIQDAKDAEAKRLSDEQKKKEAEERKAARQPDKIKIKNYIANIRSVTVPQLKTQDGKDVMVKIQELIQKFETYSSEKAEEL